MGKGVARLPNPIGIAAMIAPATIAFALAGTPGPAAAGDVFKGSCKSDGDIPCSVSVGQTYGAHTVTAADDTEATVEAVLKALQDADAVNLTPLATDIREDTGDFDLEPSPLELNAHRAFSWNYEGDARELAYVTMVSEGDDETGFAIAPIFAQGQGSVDFTKVLPEANDSGFGITVSFWASDTVPPCAPIKMEEQTRRANCMITRIQGGEVPCIHTETIDVEECKFRGTKTGKVLHAARNDKRYTPIGNDISLNGKRTGNYIVGTEVNAHGRPPCGNNSGGGKRGRAKRDHTGGPTAVPLGGRGCVTEVLLSSTNRFGLQLRNYAHKTVCTSSFPHPDGLEPISNPSPGVYCYTGAGAALNDPFGVEVNENGKYYSDYFACHVFWTGRTAETFRIWPAAKRPAVRADPLGVHPNTPIVWRPVTPLSIAND